MGLYLVHWPPRLSRQGKQTSRIMVFLNDPTTDQHVPTDEFPYVSDAMDPKAEYCGTETPTPNNIDYLIHLAIQEQGKYQLQHLFFEATSFLHTSKLPVEDFEAIWKECEKVPESLCNPFLTSQLDFYHKGQVLSRAPIDRKIDTNVLWSNIMEESADQLTTEQIWEDILLSVAQSGMLHEFTGISFWKDAASMAWEISTVKGLTTWIKTFVLAKHAFVYTCFLNVQRAKVAAIWLFLRNLYYFFTSQSVNFNFDEASSWFITLTEMKCQQKRITSKAWCQREEFWIPACILCTTAVLLFFLT